METTIEYSEWIIGILKVCVTVVTVDVAEESLVGRVMEGRLVGVGAWNLLKKYIRNNILGWLHCCSCHSFAHVSLFPDVDTHQCVISQVSSLADWPVSMLDPQRCWCVVVSGWRRSVSYLIILLHA